MILTTCQLCSIGVHFHCYGGVWCDCCNVPMEAQMDAQGFWYYEE